MDGVEMLNSSTLGTLSRLVKERKANLPDGKEPKNKKQRKKELIFIEKDEK